MAARRSNTRKRSTRAQQRTTASPGLNRPRPPSDEERRQFQRESAILMDMALRRGPNPLRGVPFHGDAAWEDHLQRHPLDKINPMTKKPVGAPFRTQRLQIEQGITVDVSTVTKRLIKTREQQPEQ